MDHNRLGPAPLQRSGFQNYRYNSGRVARHATRWPQVPDVMNLAVRVRLYVLQTKISSLNYTQKARTHFSNSHIAIEQQICHCKNWKRTQFCNKISEGSQ